MKKLHHFLPRFYLQGFTSNPDGSIEQYIFDKTTIVATNIKVAGAENFLYTIVTAGSSRDDKVEDLLAFLERRWNPSLARCRKNPEALTQLDKEWIVNFVAFQYLRVPANIHRAGEYFGDAIRSEMADLLSDDDRFQRAVRKAGIRDMKSDDLKEFILRRDRAYTITVDRNHVLAGVLSTYRALFPILFYLNWKILEAPPTRAFITSDFPVSTIIPKSKTIYAIVSGAIGNPLGEIAIPISSRYCLVADRSGSNFFKRVQVRAAIVDSINLRTIACGQSFLYAAHFDDQILDQIRKVNSMKISRQ